MVYVTERWRTTPENVGLRIWPVRRRCPMAVSKLCRMTHSVRGGIRRPLASIGLFWPALHVMASTGSPVRPDQVPFVFRLASE